MYEVRYAWFNGDLAHKQEFYKTRHAACVRYVRLRKAQFMCWLFRFVGDKKVRVLCGEFQFRGLAAIPAGRLHKGLTPKQYESILRTPKNAALDLRSKEKKQEANANG
jgi:hypothetical protein